MTKRELLTQCRDDLERISDSFDCRCGHGDCLHCAVQPAWDLVEKMLRELEKLCERTQQNKKR